MQTLVQICVSSSELLDQRFVQHWVTAGLLSVVYSMSLCPLLHSSHYCMQGIALNYGLYHNFEKCLAPRQGLRRRITSVLQAFGNLSSSHQLLTAALL